MSNGNKVIHEKELESSLKFRQGLFLGQAVGDALGAQVEFSSARDILRKFPQGVREMRGGGPWRLFPGQVTDDTELAYCLAQGLIEAQGYDEKVIYRWYQKWQWSNPFDCGNTTRCGLQGHPILESQANGAMMRISPLALAGEHWDEYDLMECARKDARMTHPNLVCQEANALFVFLLQQCLKAKFHADELYNLVQEKAVLLNVSSLLQNAIDLAKKGRYSISAYQEGWVVYAFHNALYQLLHASSFEEGLVDTINQGGDTDTTGAICGAMLGAYFGVDNIPWIWRESVLQCKPQKATSQNPHHRPEFLWPSRTLEWVEKLKF